MPLDYGNKVLRDQTRAINALHVQALGFCDFQTNTDHKLSIVMYVISSDRIVACPDSIFIPIPTLSIPAITCHPHHD